MAENTSLQVRQQETRLANTNEAKVLLPILTEYVDLYRGEIKDQATKKKNILILANELSKVKVNGRPAIEGATPSSIREIALKVITEDIDLSKKQAVIIPYGNELQLQKEFYGNVALAKQVFNNNIEFYSQLVYPNDQFEIIKNGNGFGRDKFEHTTSPKNMVIANASGKFAATPTFVYTYVVDLTNDKVIATNCFSYERCYNSWTQAGIKPTHKKFPGEMMIKTSENYVATRLYNKSNTDNDSQLQDEWEATNKEDAIEVESFETPKVEPTPIPKVETPKKATPTRKVAPKVEPEPVVVAEPEIVLETEPIYEEPVQKTQVVEQTGFDINEYIDSQNAQANNDINSFLDDDDFAPQPKVEAQPTRINQVPYREFKDKYQAQGYRVIAGTYDTITRLCDIEKVK